jgi:hypothetical protein
MIELAGPFVQTHVKIELRHSQLVLVCIQETFGGHPLGFFHF